MTYATACANIALVKYWGKRSSQTSQGSADADFSDSSSEFALNLPEAGSLSITLDALRTSTQIELYDGEHDIFELDGNLKTGRPLERISRHLDLFRSKSSPRAKVTSNNGFPSAAGLASSASGFAALTLAAADTYELNATPKELSVLARRGSGSAARSVFGGYVRMHAGTESDGSDSHAVPLENIDFELNAAIAVADTGEKKIGSTEGMRHTQSTSPYHKNWIQQVERDLVEAESALKSKDMEALAQVVEGSCLAMHANAMSARPGIIYFSSATLWAMERVRRMRSEGTPVMFTIDAGPHLVALTTPEHLSYVADNLRGHSRLKEVIVSKMGEGVKAVVRPSEDASS